MVNHALLSTAVFVFLTLMSCESGEGTLIVMTTPVPGMVSVDGKPCGESPVTITLKTGNHEVSFSTYTDQYITPQNHTVRITAGETVNIVGEYHNRFITPDPPAGFAPADSVRYFGTKERKLKDGTIFDYINGGALVYLEHGLRETTHAFYRDEEGSELTVDIFDMGTPQNAGSAFDDERICPPGFKTCKLGGGCKTYNYEPDFLIYFHKSRFLIFLSVNNDFLKDAVQAFAASIEHSIH